MAGGAEAGKRGKPGGVSGKKVEKKKMPMPVTINDCVLLWQMGYRVEINDGRVVEIRKEKKR